MAEHTMTRVWTMRVIFIFLSLVFLFFKLLPLEFSPRSWVGPDLGIALIFVWVLRRPEYVPPLSIAAVMLLADFMLQRPPGLLAGIVLIASQNLRGRVQSLRDLPFAVEYFTIAVTLAMVTLAYHFALGVLLSGRPPLGLSLIEMIATLIAYPLVMLVSKYVFGVRKSNLGEVNALGQRA